MLKTAMMRWNFFAASFRYLTALERLEIEYFTSLICLDDLGGDDRLLLATRALRKTLASLRLRAPRFNYPPMSLSGAAANVANLPLLTSLHLDHIGGPRLGCLNSPS